jgi:hypothetical protein
VCQNGEIALFVQHYIFYLKQATLIFAVTAKDKKVIPAAGNRC